MQFLHDICRKSIFFLAFLSCHLQLLQQIVWSEVTWPRLPSNTEIEASWEHIRKGWEEYCQCCTSKNFQVTKYHDPTLLHLAPEAASAVLVQYDVVPTIELPDVEDTGRGNTQLLPHPDLEDQPPIYYVSNLVFRQNSWSFEQIRTFPDPVSRQRWIDALFRDNPPALRHFAVEASGQTVRRVASYARGFAGQISELKVELSIADQQEFFQGDDLNLSAVVTRRDREPVEGARITIRAWTPEGKLHFEPQELNTGPDGLAEQRFFLTACSLVGSWTLEVTAFTDSDETTRRQTFLVSRPVISREQQQQNLETISRMWLESGEIPNGVDHLRIGMLLSHKGVKVNFLSWIDSRYAQFTCTMYTHRTLKFLNSIRFSVNADRRRLMLGIDYGPVSDGTGGTHSAVAIYPSPHPEMRHNGNEGWAAGYVLEPWHNQKKQVWDAKLWAIAYGVFGGPKAFEMVLGNPYRGEYPTSGSGGGYFPGSNEKPRVLQGRTRFLTQSPVALLVSDSQGRRSGRTPDGVILSEIPGTEQLHIRKDDGTYISLVAVLDGRFEVELNGTDKGSFEFEISTDDQLISYGEQSIGPGEQALMEYDSLKRNHLLRLPNGRLIEPQKDYRSFLQDHVTEADRTVDAVESDASPDELSLPRLAGDNRFTRIPLISDDRPRMLGITAATADSREADATGAEFIPGVVVKQVFAGGSGAEAGLLPGDLITRIDDFSIETVDDLQARMLREPPGDILPISVIRNRKPMDLKVVVSLGGQGAPSSQEYGFPGGGYRLSVLPGWKLSPRPLKEEVSGRSYDLIASAENHYVIYLYRDFELVDDPLVALEAFRSESDKAFLQGRSGWAMVDSIPVVFVAGVVGRERLQTLYRLAFVIGDRLYEANAFTPPSNDPQSFPLVLEGVLGTLKHTPAGLPNADAIEWFRQRARLTWSPPVETIPEFDEFQNESHQPDGWSKSEHDPNLILRVFKPLRLRPGYVLRAYVFWEGDNANGIVWAMPESSDFPEPEDAPTLENHLFQAPKPWDAVDDFMEAVEGDDSQWSYLAASLLRRELREFGASWHGIDWGTHYILDEDPWQAGPARGDQLDFSRPSNVESEWKWSGTRPHEWAPQVVRSSEEITVVYYSYTGKGTQRIFRHSETYRPGNYRARVRDEELATGGPGYQF